MTPIPTNGGKVPDLSKGWADIQELQTLVADSHALRIELHDQAVTQQIRFRLTVAFLAVVSLAVGGLATVALQNAKISAQIADCTNQGGGCWDDSRARSKTNVNTILNTTIFVAECLNQFPRQPSQRIELEDCIRAELATGRQPVPIPTPVPKPVPAGSGTP